jgi:hypothetical protein
VINQVSITPERQAKYDFSVPYITPKAVLIVNNNNQDIHTFADLKGKKSAHTLTSNYAQIARENGAEVVERMALISQSPWCHRGARMRPSTATSRSSISRNTNPTRR